MTSRELINTIQTNISSCRLCGCKDIYFNKSTSCEGFGMFCDNWVFRCKNCGCSLTLAADGFLGRDFYTEQEAIEGWNKLHGPN